MRRPKREDFPYFKTEQNSIDIEELVPGCSRPDCIPSIDAPKWVGAKEASAMYQETDEFICIRYEEEVYAAPLKILNLHEIVNFIAGDGTPVAITFCPLCQTEAGYIRRLETGDTVELGVSGLLWNSALVLYDRKTLTLFSQVLSKGIVGPLTDTRLIKVPTFQTTLPRLAEEFPNARILDRDTGSDRAKHYDKEVYGDYLSSDRIIFPVKYRDDEMKPKELVHTIEANGKQVIIRHIDLIERDDPINITEDIIAMKVAGFPLFFRERFDWDRWVPSDFSFYFTARAYFPEALILEMD